jgi:thiamine biosynthesis lipoprotein ApbE
MLLYSLEMYGVTDGTVNIAMGSVLSLWHNYRSIGMDNPAEASLPPMESLENAALHINISDMVIDKDAWMKGQKQMQDHGYIVGTDFINSYQSIQISATGTIHIDH